MSKVKTQKLIDIAETLNATVYKYLKEEYPFRQNNEILIQYLCNYETVTKDLIDKVRNLNIEVKHNFKHNKKVGK